MNYRRRRHLVVAAASVITFAIFALDLWSPLQGAVAVLYIIVILLVAQIGTRRAVLLTGASCGVLALIAFAFDHLGDPFGSATVRFGVSVVAISAATLLSIRDRSARTTLAEQARLLELSHDTVIIRDDNDDIIYWNDGAQALYGWTREEAVGQRCGRLLHTDFPVEQIQSALDQEGHWSGELTRTRRDGTRIVLASRWLLRRDPEGNAVGVIESSADVTEQKRVDAERQRSEQRYKSIFNGAAFAMWEADWTELHSHICKSVPSGVDLAGWLVDHPEILRESLALVCVRDVNSAAISLFGAPAREALLGNSTLARIPPGSEAQFATVLAALIGGADMIEYEVRYVALSGRPIDVLLRMRQLPGAEPWSRVLVTALDVTERNEARARLEKASAELAHAARISTLGQLTASIAHEVNQPLSAIITYGKSAKRWLSRAEPDMVEAINCLDQIVSNGSRAAEVITRARSWAKRGQVEMEKVDLGKLIDESLALIEREARQNRITMRVTNGGEDVLVMGDRVQIQQVLVNLAINAIQAMRDINDRPRELHIGFEGAADATVRVNVRDTGSGISGDPAQIFEPFFTTKREGMGMGLSICRSIIEAQAGRIYAVNNADHGATISFTLPVVAAEMRQ
ncbi:PAS domain S-box protein [Pararhizobium sp. BT-229]|uniref:PAS domain-containing sensor histidine kinase n=1 Tax=Pararhizobium sp. BT-229 TaxID=2986923 RepID=UPI0021F7C60E|nr:PAS domain S-box protein [Pararhizobium sp. BT-229]MCV9961997.1 PAS domain S-box protein [Pararhizobium sp. BT-229]